MTVQAGLCQTCSENTLLVFPQGDSYHEDKTDLGSLEVFYQYVSYVCCSSDLNLFAKMLKYFLISRLTIFASINVPTMYLTIVVTLLVSTFPKLRAVFILTLNVHGKDSE